MIMLIRIQRYDFACATQKEHGGTGSKRIPNSSNFDINVTDLPHKPWLQGGLVKIVKNKLKDFPEQKTHLCGVTHVHPPGRP